MQIFVYYKKKNLASKKKKKKNTRTICLTFSYNADFLKTYFTSNISVYQKKKKNHALFRKMPPKMFT